MFSISFPSDAKDFQVDEYGWVFQYNKLVVVDLLFYTCKKGIVNKMSFIYVSRA